MNERQAITALDQQVVLLTRQSRAQQDHIENLCRTVSQMAEVIALHAEGRMSERDTAGYMYSFQAQAWNAMRRASCCVPRRW